MVSNNHPHNQKQPDKTLHSTNRLLRWTDVQPLVAICRSHAHQLIAKGLFPPPRKLVPGGRASAWVESEIQAWIQQRIADGDNSDPDAA